MLESTPPVDSPTPGGSAPAGWDGRRHRADAQRRIRHVTSNTPAPVSRSDSMAGSRPWPSAARRARAATREHDRGAATRRVTTRPAICHAADSTWRVERSRSVAQQCRRAGACAVRPASARALARARSSKRRRLARDRARRSRPGACRRPTRRARSTYRTGAAATPAGEPGPNSFARSAPATGSADAAGTAKASPRRTAVGGCHPAVRAARRAAPRGALGVAMRRGEEDVPQLTRSGVR